MHANPVVGGLGATLILALWAGSSSAQLDPPFPIVPDRLEMPSFANQDGSAGFIMNRGPARDLALFGSAVAGLGDVNNDGIDDFIVSAPTDQDRVWDYGECFIIFGRDTATDPANGFGATHDVLPMRPGDGVTITSASQRGSFGRSVASAGDVNGDGIPDIIIGEPTSNFFGTVSGEATVLFGRDETAGDAFPDTIDRTLPLPVSEGFLITGGVEEEQIGTSVSSAGDINNDGFDDLIIGAPASSPNGVQQAGAAYIVFGQATFPSTIDVASLDGTNGFVIHGVNADEALGTAVAGVGDMNGDGIDDLAVAAPGASVLGGTGIPENNGEVLIVYGRDTVSVGAFAPAFDRTVLDGPGGFVFRGDAGDEVGFSLAGAGDINADGFADVVAGAPSYGPPSRPSVGAAYVLYGSDTTGTPTPDPLVLADDLDGTQGFAVRGNWGFHGWSVAGGGDLNGDGIDDLLSGVPRQFGYAHALWGRDTADVGNFPPFLYAWTVGNTPLDTGTVLYASREYWYAGRSVGFIGDINNDGFDDAAIGAPHASPGAPHWDHTNPFYRSGRLYIVYGRNLDPCRAADVNGDGSVDAGDFNAWILSFNTQGPLCDQNRDGACTPGDFNGWVINFNAGCQ